ncbi:MAG: CRISPR-associated endonuclease Cas2 [Chitinophagales bacterium]|nr:CRISPR-associated endonuclease Cas2 [Chitinophagales bacterium]
MRSGEKHYLIAYDIINNKKRKKIADFLEKELFCKRINKSVFIGCLDTESYLKLFDISRQTAQAKDSIIIFELCGKCMNRIISFGGIDIEPKNTLFI